MPTSSRYLLCEILLERGSVQGPPAQKTRLDVIHISGLGTPREAPISRKSLTDIGPQVQRLLGFYRERVVFLDHSNWLCTCTISQDVVVAKRHFFLPRDWVNNSTLRLLQLNENGTLICARGNEVAIVRYLKGF
ncbi:hypothetical protein F5Y13DRAFT_171997 [Hypoxylon sp. FL1857]|nr:hypothetical protein F5Y13DRAFT_171997 [Hypoxylon sp. FL1857]